VGLIFMFFGLLLFSSFSGLIASQVTSISSVSVKSIHGLCGLQASTPGAICVVDPAVRADFIDCPSQVVVKDTYQACLDAVIQGKSAAFAGDYPSLRVALQGAPATSGGGGAVRAFPLVGLETALGLAFAQDSRHTNDANEVLLGMLSHAGTGGTESRMTVLKREAGMEDSTGRRVNDLNGGASAYNMALIWVTVVTCLLFVGVYFVLRWREQRSDTHGRSRIPEDCSPPRSGGAGGGAGGVFKDDVVGGGGAGGRHVVELDVLGRDTDAEVIFSGRPGGAGISGRSEQQQQQALLVAFMERMETLETRMDTLCDLVRKSHDS
jgi:hypothetical protein